jgi:branched-chain amino acid transport system ATP-binding protein
VQVLEGRRCFVHLSVEENLRIGAYVRRPGAVKSRRISSVSMGSFRVLKERRKSLAGLRLGRRAADGRDRPRVDGAAIGDPA